MIPMRLRIDEAPDGAWDVTLGHGHGEPVRGVVDAAATTAARLACAMLPDHEVDDEAWTHAEIRVARALADLLARSGAPGRTWLRALGRADELGRPIVLGVLASPGIATLPWELLATSTTSGPLEPTGAGAVVRLVENAPPPRPPDPRPTRCVVRHLGHKPGPIAEAVTAASEARGLPWPLSGPTEERRIVTLAVHPQSLERLLDLEREPELLRTLTLAELATIAVSGDTTAAVPPVAHGLIARGCPVVVQPEVPSAREACAVFATGVHTALLAGETLLAAVVAGRAFLREARHPTPGDRWWRVRVYVGHLSALDHAPFASAPAPSGASRPAAPTDALLRRAASCGRADGFLGVEHLAEATLDLAPREVTTLLPLLRRLLPEWRRRLDTLEPQRRDDPRTRPTPRLERLTRGLRDGFGTVELWGAIIGEPWAWGRFLGAEPPEGARGAGAVLEVLGGPEDGRRLDLRPGEVVGRASGSRHSDAALYEGLPWTDPRLSRRHLRWLDVGWAHLLAPGRALRHADEVTTLPEGPFELVDGDLVELSPATWLVALSEADR